MLWIDERLRIIKTHRNPNIENNNVTYILIEMKPSILFFSLFLGASMSVTAQYVNIPDANFKEALVSNSRINTDGDQEISVEEALSYSERINVSYRNIKDLTGIEAFVNIRELYAYGNSISTIDLSQNTALTHIAVLQNQLTTLDLSQNKALTHINVDHNQLTTLDVSQNKALEYLSASDNSLKSLNIKNGNNQSLHNLSVINNPDLTCIQIDDTNRIGSQWKKDETASYNTSCSEFSTTDLNKTRLNLYPNPVKEVLFFSEDISTVKITNMAGGLVKSFNPNGKSINLSGLPKGIYLLTATTKAGAQVTKKLIKE